MFKDISLKPTINEHIEAVKSAHQNFKCLHGFLNFGDKRSANISEEAISYIKQFSDKNNINLADFFPKQDTVE